jgi:uncharacterized protein (TIGR02246 family)
MHRYLIVPVCVLAIFACRNAPGSRSDQGGTAASASVDKPSEEQRIRSLEQRWRDALGKKDSIAVAQFYTSDAFYLPANSNGYQGRDSVRARWTSEFTGGKFDLAREPKKIEIADAGDMAYEVGTYKVNWDMPKNRRKGHAAGNYVTVWKKENGDWKTAAYIWNPGAEH